MRPNRQSSRTCLMESLEGRQLLSASLKAAPALKVHSTPVIKTVVGQLGTATSVSASTVPANGDVNPYGLAFVPQGFAGGGPLQAGDLLVSNFNDGSNSQGSGTTIVRVTPAGATSTFFQGPSGLGLTTALSVLKSGFVIVGNMPTTDGTSATVQQGSLIILNKFGLQVAEFSNAAVLNGPWDMTVNDQGKHAQLFISNVLSGTVERIDLRVKGLDSVGVTDAEQIASGYTHQSDPAALELGPTGLAYDSAHDILYVASTADNEIFSIAHAGKTKADNGTGTVVVNDTTHLHGPLGLVLAPNGDLIVANGDAINPDNAHPSEILEYTKTGTFKGEFSIDASVDGPFGIAIEKLNGKTKFAAVDDDQNTVTIWNVA